MITRINRTFCRGVAIPFAIPLLVLLLSAGLCLGKDLGRLGVPVFYGDKDDDYALLVYEYQASTEVDIKKRKAENEIEFLGYIKPNDKDDVIGFQVKLEPTAAIDDAGDDVYTGDGRGRKDKYTAVYARPEYRDRKSNPLEMAEVELSGCALDRPGAFIEELKLNAMAIVAEDRESQDFPAVVADRFIDVGHGIEIQVTSMQVKAKGLMTVKLDVKRAGGKGATIVDELFALNEDDEVIGGGRWVNELNIFAKDCEYEMVLLLEDEVTVTNFRVVLATEYEIVPVPIVVEKLFQ